MSFSAEILKDNNFNIVRLEGTITFEATIPFKSSLTALANSDSSKALIINMEKISFYGSSNIKKFFEALVGVNTRIILSGVNEHFLKVFSLYDNGNQFIEFASNEQTACDLLRLNH